MNRLSKIHSIEIEESTRLQPLFKTQEEYESFKARHRSIQK